MSGIKKKRRSRPNEEEPEDFDELKLNPEFAKKYEVRKRREILGSLGPEIREELESQVAEGSEDSEEDEEEDELGELLTKKLDKQISNTFLALRNKDPSIYDKNTIFFEGSRNDVETSGTRDGEDSSSDSDSSSGDEPVAGWDLIAKAAEATVPKLTLKDYVRETLLEEGDLPDSDAERFTKRRHVEDENEQVAQEKTKLHDATFPHSSSESDVTTESNSEGEKSISDETSGSDSDSESSNDIEEYANKKAGKTSKHVKTSKSQDSALSDEKLESNAVVETKSTDDVECEDEDDDEFFKKKVKTKVELEQEEKDFDNFTRRLATENKSQIEEKLLHSYLEKDSAAEKDRFLKNFVLNNGWLDEDSEKAPGPRDGALEAENLNIDDADGDEDEEFDNKVDEFEAKYNFRFEEPEGIQVASHARDISASMRRPDDRRKQAREAKKQRKEKEKLLKSEEIKQLKNMKKKEIQSRLLALQEAAGIGTDFSGIDLDADFDPDEFSKQMEKKFGDEYYTQDDEQLKTRDDEGVLATSKKPDAADLISSTKKDGVEVEPGVHEAVDKLMDEYYNLDYEDIVGGVPVRFKYKEVDPETFGMTAEEILLEDDKELNSMVSLKYLAPYRDRKELKMRAKTARWRAKQRRRVANGMANRASNVQDDYRANQVTSKAKREPASTEVHLSEAGGNHTPSAKEATQKSKKRHLEPPSNLGDQAVQQGNTSTSGSKAKKRKKRRFGKKMNANVIEETPKPTAREKRKNAAIEGLSEKRLAAYNINKAD